MPLDKVKIEKAPAAFADMAKKHNLLTGLIELMKGQKGLKVVVTENNIIITPDPDATLSSNELHYADSTKFIDIDGDGIFYTRRSDGALIYINGDGITFYQDASHQGIISLDNIGFDLTSGNNYTSLNPGSGFAMGAGSGEMAFSAADWGAHNMSIQNISVCNNGAANYMLVLGSAPF